MEDLFNDIPQCYGTWYEICSYGNKNVMDILEKNIEKYRVQYGRYYKGFYKAICSNPNGLNIIKKYYDTMFSIDCLTWLCRNINPEVLLYVKPFIKQMETGSDDNEYNYQLISSRIVLLHNPSLISLIDDFNDIKFDKITLYTNPEAIKVINYINQNRKNDEIDIESVPEYDSIYIDKLSRYPSAIHILEKNVDKINFTKLASNENGMDLLEQNLEYVKQNYFRQDTILNICEKDRIKLENYRINIFKECISANINAIDFLKIHPEYLCERIFSNPNIFEINWDYLKIKFNYISYKEEEIINKKSDSIEPVILLKLQNDNVYQREIDEIINIYKKRDKYLSEHELVMQLTTERLIKAVYSPHRVERYLRLYDYDICQDVYCENE